MQSAKVALILCIALVTGVWSGGVSFAHELSRIRASEHAGFARIVFDWPVPVDFKSDTRGRNLSIRFDQLVQADPNILSAQLKNYVVSARKSRDGNGVDIVMADDLSVDAFSLGRSVVVDLRARRSSAAGRRGIRLAQFTDSSRSADSPETALPVRIGSHEKYTRFVFDWTKTVDYKVQEDGETVEVRFSSPAKIDVNALRERLTSAGTAMTAKADGGGMVVALAHKPGGSVRHFRLGTKVVVDLLKESDQAKKPEAPAQPQQPAPAKPQVSAAAEPAKADPKVEPEPKSEPKTTPKAAPKAEAKAAPPEEPKPAAADRSKDEPPLPDAAPVAKVKEEALSAEKPEADGSTGEASDVSAEAPAASPDAGETPPLARAVSLVFEWPEPVGVAVFRRDPYIWAVFDKRAQLNLAALRDAGSGVVGMIEQLPVGTGTVVRMIPKPGLNPRVDLEGTNWVIRFQPSELRPQIPIALRIRPEVTTGTELELPVSEFGKILRIPDPEVGDMITVATLKAPGHGIAGKRRYPEFALLPSAQGIGIEQFNDDVSIRDGGDRGVVITVPGGLHISSVGQDDKDGADFLGPRVFNFENWFGNSKERFIPARQTMFSTVVSVPDDRRDDARLDLARFYFARGFGAEALGVLRTIEYSNQDMASQPEFRALKSAIQVYMGRPLEARKALLDPSLDQYKEIALWRGSMYLQSGDVKRAAAQFRTGEPALSSYPDPIKSRLAVELLEASLADLDIGTAGIWLGQLGEKIDVLPRALAARVKFNQGALARDSRKLDEAEQIWTHLKDGKDAFNAARAEFALIELGLQQETIEPDDAIERLDRLRYQWRGDDLELSVLRRLGQLYLAKNDYRKGLSTLRTAVTYFPDRKKVKDIAQSMTEAFRKLHLAGAADALPPLKALSLYDDFRELTPAGAEGDLMIQRLADRLVAVDLLDRAASLLAHQVRYRLKGEDRARVGAKLALINLLDRNPKGALSALRNSFQPNLPYDVEDDRRRIRAKATMELGRFEDAIALLAGDVSREADLLRANIYWHTKDYSEAAKVLQRLAGDPIEKGAYPEDQARYILSWTVALRLKRDEPGVKMLRELYGPGMSESKLADAFAYISNASPGNAESVEEMSRRIAETDKFEAFLKNYRDRLIEPPATAAAKDAPPDAAGDDAPENGTVSRPPAAAPDAGAIPPPPPPPS